MVATEKLFLHMLLKKDDITPSHYIAQAHVSIYPHWPRNWPQSLQAESTWYMQPIDFPPGIDMVAENYAQ